MCYNLGPSNFGSSMSASFKDLLWPLFYYTNDNHLWKHSDSASPRGVSFIYSTEGDKTDLLERCQPWKSNI